MSTPDHSHNQLTYIRRRGRLTQGQARALAEDADRYRIEPAQLAAMDWLAQAPVGVEIGFGMGEALLNWAQASPGWRLFGIELYQPGIGALSAALCREDIRNVQIIEHPAQLALRDFPAAALQEIHIYFPDPWPKKRHLRRRLIQPDFVTLLAEVLKDGGEVHLATDWQPYAEWMRSCFMENADFQWIRDEVRGPDAQSVPASRQSTKFERRGQRLGHDICDLVLRRRPR